MGVSFSFDVFPNSTTTSTLRSKEVLLLSTDVFMGLEPITLFKMGRRRSMSNELYNDCELVRRAKLQRLRWLVHMVRIDDEAAARKIQNCC